MATSKLQRFVGNQLDTNFPQFTIRENYRPDWLISSKYTKLELDFYIEELGIALEIQGAQHYQFTPFFHSSRDVFEKQQVYDLEKKDLCLGKGIKLIEIFSELDILLLIKEIKASLVEPQIEKHSNNQRNRENKIKRKEYERLSVGTKKVEIGKFIKFAKSRIRSKRIDKISSFKSSILSKNEIISLSNYILIGDLTEEIIELFSIRRSKL